MIFVLHKKQARRRYRNGPENGTSNAAFDASWTALVCMFFNCQCLESNHYTDEIPDVSHSAQSIITFLVYNKKRTVME